MVVYNRISDFRKKYGMSQSFLGSLVGVSKNTISLYESQRMQPSLRVAFGLMHVFDCYFADLFYIDFEDDI